jgi:hypothetical protein
MYLNTTMLSRRTAHKLLEAEGFFCSPSELTHPIFDPILMRIWYNMMIWWYIMEGCGVPHYPHYKNHPVLIWNDATSLETSWVTVLIDVRKIRILWKIYGRRGLDLTHQATSRDGCKAKLKLVPGDASHVKLSRWRMASQRHLNWHLCRPINDWKGWKVEITSENVAVNMSQIGGLVSRLKPHVPSFPIIFPSYSE